ncbi:uncharacterized protein LOC134694464 [Mytilus trossulus]|uniref:uncharacterized protein LOC134694464 n=1 Tax=Mytilus trossulus TaxID=6551 RepID=UPI003006709F
MGPDGDHADIETIPDPRDLELPKTVVIDNNEELSVLVFDIETTGFEYDSEIVQLSAVCDKGEFDKYIIPTKPIHPKATEVTHLFRTGTRLYYKGQQLKTEPKENVFNGFIDWLPENALLVAHNCKQFDAKILVSQMQPLASTFLENLKDHMLGFSDTLPLFRVKFPKRKSYFRALLPKTYLKQHTMLTMRLMM